MAIPSYFMPQGVSADLIATKYGFSRDDVDAYAVQSQQRAGKAWDEGRFNKSVVPVKDVNGLTILAKDEHMRPRRRCSRSASYSLIRGDGTDGRLRRGGDPVASEVEKINYVHHAGIRPASIDDGRADEGSGQQSMV